MNSALVCLNRYRNDHNGAPVYDPHSETCRGPVGKEMWLSLKGQVAGKAVIRFSRLSEGVSSVLVAI